MLKFIIYLISFLLFSLFKSNIAYSQSHTNGIRISNNTELSQKKMDDFYNNLNLYINKIKPTQQLESRSNFKMRLDSSYIWKRINSFFLLDEKIEFVYKEDNLKEIDLFYSIDETRSYWEPKAFAILYFNSAGLLTKQTYDFWTGDFNSINDHLPLLKREFTYDENNNLILYEYQGRADILNGIVSTEIIREYDQSGNLIKNIWNRWNSIEEKLTIYKEFDYSYNSDNLLEEEIRYQNHTEGGWEKTDSIIYQYDDFQNLILRSAFTQIFQLSLDPWTRDSFIYNTKNQVIKEIKQSRFNIPLDDWRDISNTEHFYDNFGNLVSSATFDSTQVALGSNLTNEYFYTHNNNILSEDVLLPRQNVWDINSSILERSKVNPILVYEEFVGGGIDPQVLFSKAEYFYSDLETSTTGIELDNALTLTLSPNPSSDFISIDIDNNNNIMDVSIIDTQGRLIVQTRVLPNQELDISHLGQGIYFCKVGVDDEFVIERFVKM